MKQKFKNTKGITLVALIITIIILLILAVVAITSIKNNNIIEYAKNGRDNYIQKRGEEEEKINSYEQYIKDNIPNSGASGDEKIFYFFKCICIYKLKDGKWSDIIYNRDGTVESTQDVGFYKIKGDTITYYEDETFDENNSMQYLIKDRTIDGKTYKCLTIAGEDESLMWCGFETMPPVRTDLEGKRYGYKENENDETLTYGFTVKIYNINGQKVMSFYDSEGSDYSEDDDWKRDTFVIFDGNTIYEFLDGVISLYGKINDDGTIDEYDEGSESVNIKYYVMDNN